MLVHNGEQVYRTPNQAKDAYACVAAALKVCKSDMTFGIKEYYVQARDMFTLLSFQSHHVFAKGCSNVMTEMLMMTLAHCLC